MTTPNEKLRLFAPTLSDTGVPPAGNVDDATTAETDTSKRLAPDGAGGVAWGTGGGGVTYGTPALTLGTSNAAGATDEAIRRDATLLVFDATVPTTQAFGDAAATGSATVAARRDHLHGMPATPAGLTHPQVLARTMGS